MDVFYRFSVVNTALGVIGKEVMDKLGTVGGPWLNALYLWILGVFIYQYQTKGLALEASTLASVCFLVAYGYQTVAVCCRNVKYLNLVEISFLLGIAEHLVKFSFPMVIWQYVWRYAKQGVKLTLKWGFGYKAPDPWVVYTLAAVVVAVVVRLCCQKSPPNMPTPPPAPTTQVTPKKIPPAVAPRPPSSRIRARQLQHALETLVETKA